MPQGTMPSKWLRSGDTLSAIPCVVTHLLTRTPIAAILLSPPGRPGCLTQTPIRPATFPRAGIALGAAMLPFFDLLLPPVMPGG